MRTKSCINTIVERRKPGTLSNVQQYMLLDTRKRKLRPLLDAPKSLAGRRDRLVERWAVRRCFRRVPFLEFRRTYRFRANEDRIPLSLKWTCLAATCTRSRVSPSASCMGCRKANHYPGAPDIVQERAPRRLSKRSTGNGVAAGVDNTRNHWFAVDVTLEEDANSPPKIS